MYSCDVILDSFTPSGQRLATLQLTYPRFIHEQMLTHRVFSRNSSSSRAMPVNKVINQCKTAPASPIFWGKNQPGMQAYESIDLPTQEKAEYVWEQACKSAINAAEELQRLGIHKQTANRVLHPYQLIQVVVSSTEWENFFQQRLHPTAQPESQELAGKIYDALSNSRPKLLQVGEWHLPYLTPDDDHLPIELKVQISAARCARVSYFLHDGRKPDIDSDLALFEKLAISKPPHLSPLEHPAVCLINEQRVANFTGWCQLRYLYEWQPNRLKITLEPNEEAFSGPVKLIELPDIQTWLVTTELRYFNELASKDIVIPYGYSMDTKSNVLMRVIKVERLPSD